MVVLPFSSRSVLRAPRLEEKQLVVVLTFNTVRVEYSYLILLNNVVTKAQETLNKINNIDTLRNRK